MTDGYPRYQFLPWVRQGAATIYKNPDKLEPVLTRGDGQPLLFFSVQLKINDVTPADVPLRLAGPGDVTGIDPRVVIRVDPPPRTTDCEPNYLAYIEFDTPDFPWLFTPAAASAKGRLRPWLVLVVVEVSKEVRLDTAPGQLLPILTTPSSELPDLIESWAWAHAQVIQPDESQSVEHILAGLPNQNLSRLICPRRLKPAAHYLACLVPAFEVGRKAGLGDEVTLEDQHSLAPAWDQAPPVENVSLPVYYNWKFSTGPGGDFESLAERLKGFPAPEGIGRRSLHVADQPFGLPDQAGLLLEGALISIEAVSSPDANEAFRTALRELLNLSAAKPVVTPPIYGRWQSSQMAVPDENELPAWLRRVNLHPANRAAAGFGTRVVQERQEQLVASAWEQLGDLRMVVQLERRLEVAVALLNSVMRRRIQKMDPGQLVQFLGPAQTRMRASPETLRARLSREGLPSSYSSTPFRRALRPAGSVLRRAAFSIPPRKQAIADRMTVKVPAINPDPNVQGLVNLTILKRLLMAGQLTPAQQRYQEAVIATQTYFDRFSGGELAASPTAFVFNDTLKADLITSLAPQQTVPVRFYAQILTADGPVSPAVPGESVIPGPTFPQPMYEALRDLSPDYLLPGLEKLEPDTVTLLNSNPPFIEAFMLGLNHEMASELLWREFRGDLRHTYFRVFWDTRGSLQSMGQLTPIHQWTSASQLGANFSSGKPQLVLLIRGALLQRYPDALIYAIRAKSLSELGEEQKFPLFRGRIEPDITFLGFDLTDEEARGGNTDPGWFFAIQQQPSAPRFGMDESRDKPLRTWNDLGWNDVATEPGAHLLMQDLPASSFPQDKNGLEWDFNAAHIAGILRQRPVRVAMHARRLLPPVTSP